MSIGEKSTDQPGNEYGSEYIIEPRSGFYLRGADNQGKCYNIRETLTTPVSTRDDALITDKDDLRYFEDPLLTFDNSIVYGCSMELNYEELKEFCESEGYKNLMIF